MTILLEIMMTTKLDFDIACQPSRLSRPHLEVLQVCFCLPWTNITGNSHEWSINLQDVDVHVFSTICWKLNSLGWPFSNDAQTCVAQFFTWPFFFFRSCRGARALETATCTKRREKVGPSAPIPKCSKDRPVLTFFETLLRMGESEPIFFRCLEVVFLIRSGAPWNWLNYNMIYKYLNHMRFLLRVQNL